MSDLKQLLQLHDFQHKAIFCLQLELYDALFDDLGEMAAGLREHRNTTILWLSSQSCVPDFTQNSHRPGA